MQWIADHVGQLVGGTGGLGVLAALIAYRKAIAERVAAMFKRDEALAPKLLDRISALEARDKEATGRFEAVHAKLEACEQQHSECRSELYAQARSMTARDRAIDLLARELERRTTPVGRP